MTTSHFANNITIRRGDKSDAPQMGSLASKSYGKWGSAAISEELSVPASRCWIAEGASPVGYLLTREVLGEWEIIHLLVSPSMRRRGIGRLLLDHALSEMAKQGAQKVFLEVRFGNISARSLYDSAGFVVCGKRKAYYSEPSEDAVVMMLQLSA